jgi:hypothetical protein
MIKLLNTNLKIENEVLIIYSFDNKITTVEISKIKCIYLKKNRMLNFYYALLFISISAILNIFFEVEITLILGVILFLTLKKLFSEIIEHVLLIKEIDNKQNKIIVLKKKKEEIKKIITVIKNIQFERQMNY